MTASRPAPALLVGAGLDLVAVAALLLPWWRAGHTPALLVAGPSLPLRPDTWAGWEITGGVSAAVLLALVAATALAAVALRGRRPVVVRALVVATGVVAATFGVSALVSWGVTAAPGAWVATVAGAGAGAVAGRPMSRVGASAALLVAVAASLLPGAPPRLRAEERSAGPFVQLAEAEAPVLRSGAPGLRTSPPDTRLVVVAGEPAVAAADGLARLDEDGRTEVLARVPQRDRHGVVLGVAGDRVARWVSADAIAVTGLRPGDPLAVVVDRVAPGRAGPVGADGSLWLRAAGDPPGTVRRLDLAAYRGAQFLAATALPVVLSAAPDLDVRELLPVSGGALRTGADARGGHVERIAAGPGAMVRTVLAGGAIPACGLTRTARGTHLPAVGPLTVDAEGAVWFPVAGRPGEPGTLVRLAPDGLLAAVPHPLPGPVRTLAAADGAIDMIVAGAGWWRLPDAPAELAELPPTPAGCGPG